ncbi:hypothetical protein PWG71_25205 [Nocardiopsis sp. N85]|uniref:hypothetical protein n=1 Tax=Nocardiopsis sp. N85 TaxID=3029400 RepID=UPI00237FC4F4|nr:hypothetical protein [Nocardiopsis sp. N85]MDE3724698.1 hypothetical protein [Nocardiopsis sp. N85]
MTPARTTGRRLFDGTALVALAAAFGLTVPAPAAATSAAAVDPLVWGNAQAWAANGDVVAGYSTAVGFGGENEERGDTTDVFGPLAPYIDIEGSSHTVIDDDGARSTAVVESAVLRLTVIDLVALGMIDVPADLDLAPSSPTETPTPGDGEAPHQDVPTPEGEDGPRPQRPPAEGDDTLLGEESESPGPSPSPDGGEVVALDDADTRRVSADNTLEISVSDIVTTASAGFDGRTGTTFEHGALTAFGVPLEPLEDAGDGYVVEDVLVVLDEEGEVIEEVPVAVRFLRTQETFDDQDPDWRGQGTRSRLTVSVRVGDADDGNGFAVDFADSWALGSTYVAGASASPDDRSGSSPQAQERSNGDLAMTGGSLAALVTAAVVAIGGGSAATFLARKRTTAMDDRIED